MRTQKVQTPWGPVGNFTYKRTYSRRLDEFDPNSKTEEFPQTIERVLDACETQLKCGFTKDERKEIEGYMLGLKASVAGRFLWQLGTTTVGRLGLMSLQNCAFTIVNEPIRPFTWTFDALMVGSGVGVNIQKEYVYEIPKVKAAVIERKDTKDADFIVPDSREGWVKLLENVLRAHFETGKGFSYSTICVRGKGALIKGFGGIASGPEELCWGMTEISKVLNARAGKKLRPIDALDIINIIGFVVVSGNVRRSAIIALGDMDDPLFVNAKRWDLGTIPKWRAMSNNTVVCNDFSHLPNSFWAGYEGNGEPYGLLNLKLGRKVGRLGESEYPDPHVSGCNPCAEQLLADKETCCLAEIILPNVSSKEELKSISTYLYRICKHSLALPCHLTETEEVVHSLMRMGIGITGYLQATEEQKGWLSDTYKHLRAYDKKYSKEHGWPASVKLTTVKPSGCQPAETLTITNSGILSLGEIGDVNGKEWQEISMSVAQENKDSPATKFFVNGTRDTVILKMESGGTLESTHNHKYRVVRDGQYLWVDAKDIVVGDMVPYRVGGYSGGEIQKLVSVSSPSPHCSPISMPEELSEEMAYFLGLYIGDGSNHNKGIRIAGNVNDTASLERVRTFMQKSFGIDCKIYSRSVKNGKNVNNADLYVNSTHLLAYLSANGLLKNKTENVEIPLKIRMSPPAVIKSFIDGYRDADGHISKGGHTIFCTISEKMASQLLITLRAIGHACSLKLMPPTKTSWGKAMRYRVVVNKGHSKNMMHSHNYREYPVLQALGLENFLPDYVEAIDEGKCDTFDIEVPDNNTYIANSYVSHNTLSLLPGVTPGIHPGYSQFFIRRIRVAANSPMAEVCRKGGYDVEFQKNFDGSDDYNTVVVSFPCSYPKGTVLAKDLTAVQQLEYVKRAQAEWSDNAVSCTVYYKKEELAGIRDWLSKNYNSSVKSVSFLLHSDHGFAQAPYEEITEAQFNEMSSKVKPFESVDVNFDDMLDNLECAGGSCPIR